MRHVTVTPVSFSSFRIANEKESINAFVPLYGLVGAWDEACDRSSDQYPTRAADAHVAPDLLDQVNGPGDVRIDHVTNVLKILIKEGLAKPMACVGQQGGNGPIADGVV